jgi:hypothetical protein
VRCHHDGFEALDGMVSFQDIASHLVYLVHAVRPDALLVEGWRMGLVSEAADAGLCVVESCLDFDQSTQRHGF